MMSMFKECISLKSINLSNFYCKNIESMSNMFEDCNSLTSIILSKYYIYNDKNKNIGVLSLFDKCYKLTYLNISCFTNQAPGFNVNDKIFGGLPSSGTIIINKTLSKEIKDQIPKNWNQKLK